MGLLDTWRVTHPGKIGTLWYSNEAAARAAAGTAGTVHPPGVGPAANMCGDPDIRPDGGWLAAARVRDEAVAAREREQSTQDGES